MKICIDTNIYSALKNGVQNVIELLENADEVYIPTIVLGELYAGFNMGNRLNKNIKGLGEFLNLPGIYTIDINNSIADRYGVLIKTLKENGTPIPTNDVWIAAAAFEKGAKIASFDSHFQKIPGLHMVSLKPE